MNISTLTLADLAAPLANAIVGGPFGSNLVSKDYVSIGVPVIRGQNMGNKWVTGEFVFVSPEKATQLAANKARPGDIVFTQRGTLGQVSIVPNGSFSEYIVSQSQMKITPDPNKADVAFLYYLFRTEEQRQYIFNAAIQTGVPHTNLGILKKTPIRLPSISAQRQIAAVLSAFDTRIDLLRETNVTLEAIAQALFKSWFVDFDPVRAKAEGREPEDLSAEIAGLFPNRLEVSPLGPIPVGWSINRVEEIAKKIGMGPFGSNIKVSTFCDQGVPVISGQHLRHTLMEDLSFNFITEAHAEKLKNSCVFGGDVVFTHAGNIGQVALIHADAQYERYVLSQRQFFLRCDEKRMVPAWITYFFRSDHGQHLLLANASQVGVPSIARPVSYLRSIQLVVPPIQLLLSFAEAVDPLHKQVLTNRKRIESLSLLRDTLLTRLTSGQLRLPEANAPLQDAA